MLRIAPRAQDYDFDYEEDDDEQEADADIENMYYNAKSKWRSPAPPPSPEVAYAYTDLANSRGADKKSEDPDAAIKDLQAVVDKEEPKGDW